jgi:hypothetical protein
VVPQEKKEEEKKEEKKKKKGTYYTNKCSEEQSWGISVSIVSDYRLVDRGSITGRGKGFFFPLASVSRPALRLTQPPIQWVLGVLFPGVTRGRGVTLTTHPI